MQSVLGIRSIPALLGHFFLLIFSFGKNIHCARKETHSCGHKNIMLYDMIANTNPSWYKESWHVTMGSCDPFAHFSVPIAQNNNMELWGHNHFSYVRLSVPPPLTDALSSEYGTTNTVMLSCKDEVALIHTAESNLLTDWAGGTGRLKMLSL